MCSYDHAESHLTQAIQIRKRTLGENHPDYAQSLNNLAGLYYEMGRYDEAEPLYIQAIDICQRTPEDELSYANSLNNLAMLYQAMGKYGKVETLYKQSIEITEKVLGDGHPKYATTLGKMVGQFVPITFPSIS